MKNSPELDRPLRTIEQALADIEADRERWRRAPLPIGWSPLPAVPWPASPRPTSTLPHNAGEGEI